MAPYNPPVAHYAHVKVEESDMESLPMLIGKKGNNLKYWTQKYGLQYIWYNNDTKCIEMWGPYKSFEMGCKEGIENEMMNILLRGYDIV